MKRKGFTLIEVLAVIVILAIIALIATPIMLGVIENARRKAFEDTGYGVIEGVRAYYVEKLSEEGVVGDASFTFPNSELKLSGTEPAGGNAKLYADGSIEIAIHNNRWCATKSKTEDEVTTVDYVEGECKIQVTGVEEIQSKVGEETSGYEGCTGTGSLVDLGDKGIRYQGKCPNNYVTFNGEEAGWRIIGIIDGKLKLIRDESIGEFSWDNKDTTTGAESDYGKNEWTEARLMKLLNPSYENEEVGGSLYWNRKSGNCYFGQNNGTTKCDFRSTGLTVEAQNMIDQNSKWYLGGWNTPDITKDVMYEKERGTTTWNNSRKTEWTGAIGLMYPSDYGYAAGEGCEQTLYYYNDTTCRSVNWMDKSMSEWNIAPNSDNSGYAFLVRSSGIVYSYNRVYSARVIRPVLYLQANVKISGGEGTPTSPYVLSQ